MTRGEVLGLVSVGPDQELSFRSAVVTAIHKPATQDKHLETLLEVEVGKMPVGLVCAVLPSMTHVPSPSLNLARSFPRRGRDWDWDLPYRLPAQWWSLLL